MVEFPLETIWSRDRVFAALNAWTEDDPKKQAELKSWVSSPVFEVVMTELGTAQEKYVRELLQDKEYLLNGLMMNADRWRGLVKGIEYLKDVLNQMFFHVTKKEYEGERDAGDTNRRRAFRRVDSR